MRKIILTTGGTGGHIFPALAVGEAILELDPRAELLFVGATYGPEAKLVGEAGITFVGLPGRGMLGRGIKALPAALDNLLALTRALKIVRQFRPCVVAAFGGYASFPAAVAAKLLGVPLLIHEQNAIAGTVNRVMGRFANRRCVSTQETGEMTRPYVFTGNPVRRSAIGAVDRRNRKTKNLLVLGGSQGAHSINRAMCEILNELKANGVEILHQTGQKDLEETRAAYEMAGYDVQCVQPFISDMGRAYGWADLVFCRAGASTIAELLASGLPAVLTPFPSAIHDHQTLNAQALADAGCAVITPETRISEVKKVILELFEDREQLGKMTQAAVASQNSDAAHLVALEIMNLCRKVEGA